MNITIGDSRVIEAEIKDKDEEGRTLLKMKSKDKSFYIVHIGNMLPK